MTAATPPGRPELLRGRVVTGGAVIDDGYVEVTGGRVSGVGPVSSLAGDTDVPEPQGTLLPGLIDLHCHGGGGASVTSGDRAEVEAVARHHQRAGTTSLVASTVTDTRDRMRSMVRAAAQASAASVVGVHVEGPFLSPQRRGAHAERHLVLPDPGLTGELLEAGDGRVRIMTLAPELPGADVVIDLLDR